MSQKSPSKIASQNCPNPNKHGDVTCPYCLPIAQAIQAERQRCEGLRKVISGLRRSQWPEGECFGEKAYLVPCSDFGRVVNALSSPTSAVEAEVVKAQNGGMIEKRVALDLGVKVLDWIRAKQSKHPMALVNYWIRQYMKCIDNEKFIEPSVLRAQDAETAEKCVHDKGNLWSKPSQFADEVVVYKITTPICPFCKPQKEGL